jgi:DNA-binding CsgD family transcriptional regulator
MLGEEVGRVIREAWSRARQQILSDPDELRRRLARRRSKSLTRPPRAWCIAIRASDRRITPAHWVIFPEHALDLDHPEHPYQPIEHEVTIQKHAIRRYCNPVSFSAEDAADVAKILGVSPSALLYSRSRGLFDERYIQGLGGKRGKPVPLLSPHGQLLDPGFARFYARPHPAWGPDWEFFSRQFPADFEQTILRKPHFARVKPKSHHPDDPAEFWGWRWICPACKKPVRTIYYPLPVRTMFDRWFIDPAQRLKLGELNLPEPPLPTFACRKCHNVQYISTTDRHGWNQIITYLSAGLLYGQEVPIPASFTPERKRTRIRQLHRQAPMRRKVLTRLANGWSNFQIAKDLQISRKAVNQHIYIICKEEDVPDRHALADKLNFAVSPPLNYIERALARRFQVREMLLQNCTYQEMCKELSASFSVISADVKSKSSANTASKATASKPAAPSPNSSTSLSKPPATTRAKKSPPSAKPA